MRKYIRVFCWLYVFASAVLFSILALIGWSTNPCRAGICVDLHSASVSMWGFQIGYFTLLPLLTITPIIVIILAELVLEKRTKMKHEPIDTFMKAHQQKPPDHYGHK